MQYISHYQSPLGGILLAADETGPVWLAGFGPDAPRLAAPGAPALELRAIPLRRPASPRGSHS